MWRCQPCQHFIVCAEPEDCNFEIFRKLSEGFSLRNIFRAYIALSFLVLLIVLLYFRNCSTVFTIAEAELGIPSLLDPADMAECKSPDRLSILTYLSEFYHKFKAEKSPQGSPQTSKKDETAETGTKTCPDLKRKDSCDSGVSVSPLGSVCNSPPYHRKESPAPVTTLPKKEASYARLQNHSFHPSWLYLYGRIC